MRLARKPSFGWTSEESRLLRSRRSRRNFHWIGVFWRFWRSSFVRERRLSPLMTLLRLRLRLRPVKVRDVTCSFPSILIRKRGKLLLTHLRRSVVGLRKRRSLLLGIFYWRCVAKSLQADPEFAIRLLRAPCLPLGRRRRIGWSARTTTRRPWRRRSRRSLIQIVFVGRQDCWS